MDHETENQSNCSEAISKPRRNEKYMFDPCPFLLGDIGVPAGSCIVWVLATRRLAERYSVE